ncbi:MAG: hypothetical protein IPG49_12765, partial [Proteobacteria bacterium]|nr:hypothetical protein [Pseudomonadota bacterium]
GALTRRLADLTKHQRLNLGEAASRLRFPAIAARPAGPAFGPVASATLQREQLWIEYRVRSIRLVPGCLGRRQGRAAQLAIDRIRRATVLPDTALDIPEAQLDEHYASACGIFGGKADKVAVLVFTAERALGGG